MNKDNHFPQFASYTVANAAQDAFSLLCYPCMLMARVQLADHQDSRAVSRGSAHQLGSSGPVCTIHANKNVIHCLCDSRSDTTDTHSSLAWPFNDILPQCRSGLRRVTSARGCSAHLPVCHSHTWAWQYTFLIQILTQRLTLGWPHTCLSSDQHQTSLLPCVPHLSSGQPLHWSGYQAPASGTLLVLPEHCGTGAQARSECLREALGCWSPGLEVCWEQ